jgi:conjugal transfer pilus assembly protein TraW
VVTRSSSLGARGVVAAALASSLLLTCAAANAADLGTIGPVYPIAEPDMLDEIQAILKAKQASGELERLQQAAHKRMRAAIETPAAVKGLTRAKQRRAWDIDPSVRFDESIVDHEGRVVIPAGTLANPLSVVRLSKVLLFIDGRDRAQVAAAKRLMDASPLLVVPILTGGSPTALSRAWQRQVFFDQDGRLVQRFGIQAVPARVSQHGLVLRVEEFPA